MKYFGFLMTKLRRRFNKSLYACLFTDTGNVGVKFITLPSTLRFRPSRTGMPIAGADTNPAVLPVR